MGINTNQKPTLAAVDVDVRQVKYAAFNVHGHGLFCAEWAGATDEVACVAVGGFGFARFNLFAADLPREFFGRDFAVAVHEDDEGVGVFVLEYQGFDDGMFGRAQFTRRYAGTAMRFVGVEMWGERDFVCFEELGRWGFGSVNGFAHGGVG